MYLRRRLSGSVVSLSCPKLTEGLAVLLQVRRGEVVHLVLLQKHIHPHPRLETKQPSKLSCREGWDLYASSARLSSAALGTSFHLDLSSCMMSSGNSNVICMAVPSPHYLKDRASHYFVSFTRRRDLRNKAYNRTSSRSASSSPAATLRSAVVRDLGPASGKKAVIGTSK